MKSESYFLQGRIERIENFLGLNAQNQTVPTIKFNQKIQQLASKWPRDIQNKYEKVKKITDTYSRVLEQTISSDKMEVLESEQDQLNEIAVELEQIQQLSAMMNFQPLMNLHQRSKDLSLLNTTSKLNVGGANQPLKLVEYSQEQLTGLNIKKREQFQQVVNLYNQMIGNLNYRLQQIFNKVSKIETK